MNKENLLQAANYLDHGNLTEPFCMRNYCQCALGHSLRFFEGQRFYNDQQRNWNPLWVQGAEKRLFGIDPGSNESAFAFGSNWADNRYAAAARFRYLAIHGAAPSAEQWNRFHSVPSVVEVEELDGVSDEHHDNYNERKIQYCKA